MALIQRKPVAFRVAARAGRAYLRLMSDVAKALDPTGLIREAYRIEGITAPDCRGIFFDWALGLEDGRDSVEAAAALLEHYADQPADHPMTVVLREATERGRPGRRRGGAMGRRR